MRKTVSLFISLAAVAMALLSCDKEVDQKDNVMNATKGITVNVIAENAATRTAVVDGEIPTVTWLNSDKISLIEIVDDEIKGIAESAGANITDGKADFSTTLGWEASGTSYKYSAVYPAGRAYESSGKYYIYLPEEQHLNGNNFSDDSDILISTVYDHGASRVEDGEPLMFTFSRLGTVVRLNLIGLAAGEKINKIVFTGPDAISFALEYDPTTGTIDPETAFYLNNSITLYLDDYASSGSGDPIWFRVLPKRNWDAGEECSIEVMTDKAMYKKEFTLTSALKFPDGGLTKLGVDLSSSAVPPVAVPCLWDFESGADDWTFFDDDGDGNIWYVGDSESNHTHSGDYVLVSASYASSAALTPDNWAFTPRIQLTEDNYLSFWITAQDLDWPSEHYAVYIAKGSPTGDLTELIAETEFPNGNYVETGRQGYQHCIVQIPAAFNNEIVCIGFRHFNCTDMFRFNLDDVSVTEEYPYTPPSAKYEDFLGDWTDGYKVFSITKKVEGESYNVSGFPGQGDNLIEALYNNNSLEIHEQIVSSDGNTDIAFQSSDGYMPYYPDGSAPLILSGIFDEGENQINIFPGSEVEYYMFITYESQESVDYMYAPLPTVLVPYDPATDNFIFREGFEYGLYEWTRFDADGDGDNWAWLTDASYAYSGNCCLFGRSYYNSSALDPDNYAFTPAITLTSGNYLSYWVCGMSTSWPDHYCVYITTAAPAASADDCELLLDMTIESTDYVQYEAAIPSKYDGQTVYICFRHFDSKDNYYVFIDDVAVTPGSIKAQAVSPAPAPKFAPKFFDTAGKYILPGMKKDRRPTKVGIPIQSKKLERR